MKLTEKRIKEILVQELSRGNLSVFAGAGLSKGAGYPDWSELLNDFAEDLNLSADKESDLISLAQFYYNENSRNRNEINGVIKNKFTNNKKTSRDIEILTSLPIDSYWTTNYDTLIEDSLRRINKKPDVKRRESDLSNYLDERDAVVYKMHGDVTQPDETVIIRDDYESYHLNRGLFTDTLCGELVSKTFLFIGYSFSDPNFEKILSKIRIKLEGNQRKHYAFIKIVKETDYSSKDEYLYNLVKQKLRIKDLSQYGIHCIPVNGYDEITIFLLSLKKDLYKNNVFISGSAYSYGDWEASEAACFVRKLAESCIDIGKKVISGYGLGIGGFVIEGASQAINAKNIDVSSSFELNVFPRKIENDTKDTQRIWNRYRKKILEKCSAVIIVFGNKVHEGVITDANGVLNEFRIANEIGLKIIPIGSTGFVAEKILLEIKNDIKSFKYLEEHLEILNESRDISVIMNVIKKIINKKE